MKYNLDVTPILIFMLLFSVVLYVVYADYNYKMKRLELMEKGILKE